MRQVLTGILGFMTYKMGWWASQLFPAAPRSAPPRATACCERRATLCDATEGRHHMFAVRLSWLRTSHSLYSQALWGKTV